MLQRILTLNGGNAYNSFSSSITAFTVFTNSGATPTIRPFDTTVNNYITLQVSGHTVSSEESNVTLSIRPLKG